MRVVWLILAFLLIPAAAFAQNCLSPVDPEAYSIGGVTRLDTFAPGNRQCIVDFVPGYSCENCVAGYVHECAGGQWDPRLAIACDNGLISNRSSEDSGSGSGRDAASADGSALQDQRSEFEENLFGTWTKTWIERGNDGWSSNREFTLTFRPGSATIVMNSTNSGGGSSNITYNFSVDYSVEPVVLTLTSDSGNYYHYYNGTCGLVSSNELSCTGEGSWTLGDREVIENRLFQASGNYFR